MNERPIEYAYVFENIVEFCPKTIIDIGTGNSALPSLIKKAMITVSSTDVDPEIRKKNRHFKVVTDNILRTRIKGKYDMVLCISVLEHIKEDILAVSNMAAILKDGGHLIMTFPYNEYEYIENAYKLPEAGYRWGNNICRQYCRENIKKYESLGLSLLDIQRWRIFDGKYWTYGKRLQKPLLALQDEVHHLACVTMRR